ncbi:MAG TPA: hypothetical protein VG713_13355 [Pirellulales bacterium]|nr:hypothetical protein [Pirellulales bacterium]
MLFVRTHCPAAWLFMLVAHGLLVGRSSANDDLVALPLQQSITELRTSSAAGTSTTVVLDTDNPIGIWHSAVALVSQRYPIERNTPPALVEGQWQVGTLQTFALIAPVSMAFTAPERRSWVGVTMRPSGTRWLLEVVVVVETRACALHDSLDRADWLVEGHDVGLEQQIARQIEALTNIAGPGASSVASEETSSIKTFASLPDKERVKGLRDGILVDYANYYSIGNLLGLTAAFGIGAAMANTEADARLYASYQEHIGHQSWLHSDFKVFGNGGIVLPAMAGAFGAGLLFENRPAGGVIEEFGERGVRAALVGGPSMLLMQYVTGAGRPGEHPWGSQWKPFSDNTGVSGDAFIGGVLFMSAAKMTDRPVMKTGFYALSVLPALGRVNDGAHYPSEAFLGLCMAFAAVTAVDKSYRGDTSSFVVPWALGSAQGLGFEFKY